MKILLLGEYSRLHNSLKEGLQELGHEVVIAGTSDGFKKYPVDICFKENYKTGASLLSKKVINKLTKTDLTSIDLQNQFKKHQNNLKGYDVVQLINENSFYTVPKIEKKLLDFIFSNNKNVFLLSCGADVPSVEYAFQKKFKYSILDPYFEGKLSKRDYWSVLKYLTKPYQDLHKYIYKHIQGVIASDLDYHIPLKDHKQYLGLIPNPINTKKLVYSPLDLSDKIVIFHGVNSENYIKKGGPFFDSALKIIADKYPDKVEIIRTEDLPYNLYLEKYNRAHIILDQVLAYDQGFNALEAMSRGKVVFTGAEHEWLDYYNLKENTVAINALPQVSNLVKHLEWLIDQPENLLEISKNARAFVEKEHDYINIARTYLDTWKNHSKV
ncbi:glycosyltransferase [Xanthomarina sp. F1114]|uniref:glycosyltransferase n=1 Tax=Xanthomarina sp. F1114 TaxID=2996019 RepID=UPI00225E49F7|nr:glycosyltransferase [Xanthomarina sp. F1114]MCX7548183.1 glycosyltransferase [Xanthomarina sp. F1114]